jgi:hypothetical protein
VPILHGLARLRHSPKEFLQTGCRYQLRHHGVQQFQPLLPDLVGRSIETRRPAVRVKVPADFTPADWEPLLRRFEKYEIGARDGGLLRLRKDVWCPQNCAPRANGASMQMSPFRNVIDNHAFTEGVVRPVILILQRGIQ